jgi:hypothetical protein
VGRKRRRGRGAPRRGWRRVVRPTGRRQRRRVFAAASRRILAGDEGVGAAAVHWLAGQPRRRFLMAGPWRQRWSAPRALAPTNLKVVVIYFIFANNFLVR